MNLTDEIYQEFSSRHERFYARFFAFAKCFTRDDFISEKIVSGALEALCLEIEYNSTPENNWKTTDFISKIFSQIYSAPEALKINDERPFFYSLNKEERAVLFLHHHLQYDLFLIGTILNIPLEKIEYIFWHGLDQLAQLTHSKLFKLKAECNKSKLLQVNEIIRGPKSSHIEQCISCQNFLTATKNEYLNCVKFIPHSINPREEKAIERDLQIIKKVKLAFTPPTKWQRFGQKIKDFVITG